MPVLSGLGFRASHLDHLKRYTAIHFVPLKPHSRARLRYAYIYCEADLTRSARILWSYAEFHRLGLGFPGVIVVVVGVASVRGGSSQEEGGGRSRYLR